MQPVQCEIVENNHLIKALTIEKETDMTFHFDMFQGIRHFDVSQQYIDLKNSNRLENQQIYELFCSYLKFGQMEQEKKTLTVTLRK